MKNLSVFFNRFHKFLQFPLFFAVFLFSANFVLAEDVHYRWTPYNDGSGADVWDGIWSETVTSTETSDASARSEGKFWSFYRNTSGGEWVKTYNKSGGTADFPGSDSSKTAFVYFTGEHAATATLDSSPANELEKLFVGDWYKNTTSAGGEKITINLAGFDLKTKELIFGNSSFHSDSGVNFEISGGGTLKISSEMKFLAGCTYNIEIGEGTVLDAASVSVDAAAAGATINFTGGGTLKLAGANFSGCTVNFKLKKLESSGTFTNSGALNFSGNVEANFSEAVENSGTLSFSADSTATFSDEVKNSGTLNFSENAESAFSVGVENLSGGVISAEGSAALGFEGKVSNAGEIAFSGSSAPTFSDEIENTGTLSFLQNSSADFSAQISNSGEISFAENSTAIFSGEVKNSGTLKFSGNAETTFSGGVENISGGVISAEGSAVLDFNGKVLNAGGIAFSGSSSATFSGEVKNSGTLKFLGNAETTFSGSVENLSGGVISAEGSAVLGFEGKVSNAGEIAFSGSSAATFADEIENAGTLSFLVDSTAIFSVEVKNSGTLKFSGNAESTFSGGVENSGQLSASDSAKLDFSGKFVNSASGVARFLGGSSSSVSFGEFSNSGEIYSSGEGLKFNVAAVDSGTWIYSGGTVASENISYNILKLNAGVFIQGKISAETLYINTSQNISLKNNAVLNVASVILGANATIKNEGFNLDFGTDEKECSLTSVWPKSLSFATSESGTTYFRSCKIGDENNFNIKLAVNVAVVFCREVYATSLSASKKVEIKSAKIQTSGNQDYSSEVAVSGAGKTEIISKNGKIQFGGNVSGAENAEISVLADVVFDGLVNVSVPSGIFSVGNSSAAKKATLNANSEVSFDVASAVFSGNFNNSGNAKFLANSKATFSDEIENAGTLSFLQDSTAIFSSEVKNSGTLNFSENAESTFSGGFENSGQLSASDSAKLDFSGKFVNSASGVAKFFGGSSSSVSFGEFSNSGEISSSGEGLKFNVAAVDLGTWIYSGGTVASENISYNILNLSGAVKIDGSANELFAKEISVQTENLEIQGKISADSVKINVSKIKFVSDSVFAADSIFLQKGFALENNGYSISVGKNGGAIEVEFIEENVNFSILDGAAQKGKVEFYSSLGKPEKPLKDFSSESALVFNADVYAASLSAAEKVEIHSAKIQTSGNQNYSSEVDVSGAEKTEIISKNGLIHFRGALKTSGGAPLSLEAQNVQFDSDFECDSEAAVLADVYFSGLAKDEIKIAAEKIEIGSENSSKNLYISAVNGNSSKKVELESSLKISGSFVLLNGGLKLGKNSSGKPTDIFAEKEIVLMNGNVASMYDDVISAGFSWRSGAKNIFKYQGDENFPEKFPDGTQISSENFYSSLEGLGGTTISAGENFYCNNFALEGDSEWFLKAGDNEKSENFAVAYNSSLKNCVYSSSGTGISYLAAAESVDKGGNNENVCFGHPEISFARTVYDDVIEVSFKDSVSGNPVKIENSSNEIWKNIAGSSKFLTYGKSGSNSKIAFSGTYIDAECTKSTENQGDIEKFYLKAADSWNTDATGEKSGAAESTDSQGVHKDLIPYLNLVRAVSDDFSGIFDEHKNRVASYDGEKRFLSVKDSCPPALIAVRTGQEQHEELPENQLLYDSHNFLEFQFSEEIFVNGNDSSVLNVKTSADFGGIQNNSSGSGFFAAGIAAFEKGKLQLVSESQIPSAELNSVYRNFAVSVEKGKIPQTHRFRISIAGYQSQAAAENPSGFPYWPGCIDSENSEIPSGKVTLLSSGAENNFNELIKDSEGNSLLAKSVENHPLKNLSVISDSSADSLCPDWSDSLYGSWDLSAPVFASYRSWSAKEISSFFEILGACKAADTVLDRVEFHVFDNSESDFGGAEWFSQFGWGNDNSSLFSENSYASDIFGGSRPFGNSSGNESAKTSGGIRYSTLYNKSSYFKYGVDSAEPVSSFKNSRIQSGASSSLFVAQNGAKREISTNDSLYFSIFLENGTNLPLKTNFSIKYDERGFVTDLAGNLMKSAKVFSVDRVSPRFNMTSAKISGNKLYVLFNKKINLDEVELMTSEGVKKSFGIADSLRFIKIPEDSHKFSDEDVVSDLYIEKSVPPQKTFSSETFTGVIFTLNRKVTLEDVKNYYIQCYSPDSGKFIDPFTGIKDVKVTAVTELNIGNYMPHGEAHALSDFAVNAVNPVYAYDDRFLDENFGFSASDAAQSNIAVHDWNSEQQNVGTLLTEHDIFVVTSQDSGDSEPEETLPQNITMYFDNSPEPDSVSSEYNKNLEKNLRIWIPSLVENGVSAEQVSPVLALAPSTNSKNLSVSGEIEKNTAKFLIDWETLSKNGYSAGNQVSFLFGLADSDGSPVKISHAPFFDEISGVYKLEPQPLFALRLKNSNDPTSLDLWSFRLKNITLQRGNVTILNNVIDANKGEMSVVQVNMPSSGNLDVVVMTLDGNVIRYLQHGTASAGEHSYSWNGTTKSGKKVARGLYFVRVFGNGIDETRKIMVVKN